MEKVVVLEGEKRYTYRDYEAGIAENMPLDFHSPYGCSKGSADQYMRDYARIYGIPTVVMRQSCIYGEHQFGIEDQGWVAWFVIAALLGRRITIYGNGKQVRDVLYVGDLIQAYRSAIERKNEIAGRIFNIGGGPNNTISIWTEFGPLLEELLGRKLEASYDDWRKGDQPIYVSDISEAGKDLEWKPEVGVDEGVKILFDWVTENKSKIQSVLAAGT